VIWYNETANETKISKAFTEAAKANNVSNFTGRINNALTESQGYFNQYINTKDTASMSRYLVSLKETSVLLDSLKLTTKDNAAFTKLLSKEHKAATDVLVLKSAVDAIIDRQLYSKTNGRVTPFELKELSYNKVLDSIKTNTFIKVDNVTRKGLMARLVAAFKGKVQIQKEQLNTVVTMKYKDKVITTTIEELLKTVILNTNKYYSLEFKKLKYSFLKLRHKDLDLIKFNNELLLQCHNVLPNYTEAANTFKANSQQNLQDQYQTNKGIRSYGIAAVIFLMFLISLILFGFTRLAFEYEKRLTAAQESIRQSLNFKNRIIGMISHEIRSPLSIISIYSQKISETVKDMAVKDTFKSIQFTTNSLLLLSNQILEYSKDENHKLSLRTKNFQLKHELDQIIVAMTSLAESHGNKVALHSNIATDYEVCSDTAKIHQLFYNIIGNANKFTENGLITVTINQEELSDFELNLMVEIQDNGHGIPENDLAHIFESFYHGTVPVKLNDLGVGLGLNLCKEIIELFDGTIHVESEENQGTKVVFNLILSKV
jgi:signal transduction histidine kinase